MKIREQFYFSLRLAWRQLSHERGKLVAAALGVMFATVLVFMQLGFWDSLDESGASTVKKLQGHLFLTHKQTEALWRTVQFERTELFRTLAQPDVVSVVPLYIGQAPWKNPQTGIKRTLMVWGSDPAAAALNLPEAVHYQALLSQQDTVLFDELSRPEFGAVTALLQQGNFFTELNDRKVKTIGTIRLGTSFAADGNLILSEQNFLRIFPQRRASQIDVGIVRLSPGADIAAVQKSLRALLNENINVFTYAEMVQVEADYWRNSAPIGFIFGFGAIMGLIVGMVIVYQILFTDISNHLREFATMKAMGYSNSYLMFYVFGASLILALVGFVPGAAVSVGLYEFAESVTFIPMPIPISKILNIFLMIVTMCCAAGLLAMRKIRSANPADMF